MPRCAGLKPNGVRCSAIVKPPLTHCSAHNDAYAHDRRRAAAKAGRSRPSRELSEIKALLRELTGAVLAGEVKTPAAAVANQLLNSRLRAVELERRTADLEGLLERLERVEDLAERLRGA